jgi:hypothetical protein
MTHIMGEGLKKTSYYPAVHADYQILKIKALPKIQMEHFAHPFNANC